MIIQPDDDGYVLAPGTSLPGATAWYAADTDADLERLSLVWSDAPTENPELLEFILDTAREQVIAYAPAPGPEGYPRRLVYAQLQQATNLWNAGQVSPNGEMGPESFSFTPRPLDKNIRGIIRPTTGAAGVF
ncbi:hypothetical protein [Microbacterium sp. 22296]|uniref:hypothetical protein n=1 Tax=Microbacterium sp. 22296 TaxID=3453903 RepID=UPI003F832201